MHVARLQAANPQCPPRNVADDICAVATYGSLTQATFDPNKDFLSESAEVGCSAFQVTDAETPEHSLRHRSQTPSTSHLPHSTFFQGLVCNPESD